jgi:RimJ/RimL family protein N-acetyltransferase
VPQDDARVVAGDSFHGIGGATAVTRQAVEVIRSLIDARLKTVRSGGRLRMIESGRRRDHVQLRDVEDGDLELFFAHQTDREATRMAAFPSRDREAFMTHWEMIRADQAVVTQTVVVDGQVAGNLVSWDQDGHPEIGYWIGRDYWGRGIATDALALFVDRLEVRPLRAYVAVHNIGSMRVLEKCGFRRAAAQEALSSPAKGDMVASEVEHIMFVLNV